MTLVLQSGAIDGPCGHGRPLAAPIGALGRIKSHCAGCGRTRPDPTVAGMPDRRMSRSLRESAARHHWTLDEVHALGVTTDLVTACSVIYKVGKSQAYARFRAGTLDFPAFRSGHMVVVPVAPLLRLLNGEKASAEGEAA